MLAVFRYASAKALALISAYLEQGVLDRSEVARTLTPMVRMRWAVQAGYFARRISSNDLTGINGLHENEKGLEDARLHLARDQRALTVEWRGVQSRAE